MRAAALGARFVVELCLLAGVAYWGAGAGGGTAARVLLAIAAPVAVAIVWGLVISPKARFMLRRPLWVVVQLGLFGLGVAALVEAGSPELGIALAVVAVGDLAVLLALGVGPGTA